MYKYLFLLVAFMSLAQSQTPLSFQTALERRLTLDAGLHALDKHYSAIDLNAESENALAATEFETALEDFGQEAIEFAARQTFEAPSIRKKRLETFNTEKKKLKNDMSTYQDQVHYQLSLYFLEAYKTLHLLELDQDRLSILEQILSWQVKRFEAGALAESELIRTRLAVAELATEVARVEVSLIKIASEISLYLDQPVASENLPTELPTYIDGETIHQTWNQFENAPILRHQEAQLAILRADKQLADIPSITSLSVTAGLRIVPVINQQVPFLGFSLEAPLFSKQKALVQAKELEIQAGLDDLDYLESTLHLQRNQWEADWIINNTQLDMLQENLIPKATLLQDKINQEYWAGARQYLDVLDAQNLLTDLQAKALDLEVEKALQLFDLNLTLGVKIYEFK